jgi:xanthine dehydrogenase accessory factor
VRILVRGSGDVASAVAHALFSAGHAVALHDGQEPNVARRLMSFADALFDGVAELDGVMAVRTDRDGVAAALGRRGFVPITTAPFEALLDMVGWQVLVDARMRKREVPEPQIGLAPLTIGLGPNFVAGETVTAAIETSWEDLGRVVLSGPTLPLSGEPRAIAGKGRERYVYAPLAGRFASQRRIGEPVAAGEVVGWIGDVPLAAPIDGAIRGLSRSGISVACGAKIIEIDPRGPAAVTGGIGERPRRIAQGVVAALSRLSCLVPADGAPPAA